MNDLPPGFSVLGRWLMHQGLSAALRDSLKRSWFFPEHGASGLPHVGQPYSIHVQETTFPPTPKLSGPLSAREVVMTPLQLTVQVAPNGFSFEHEGSWLLCEHGGEYLGEQGEDLSGQSVRQTRVWVGGAPCAEVEAALDLAVAEGLRRSGLLPLHASAASLEVEGRGGQVCAFLGASGQGKSTTLLAALRQGWQPVAEDLLWLDPASLTVYGWEREVRLLPSSLGLLPVGLEVAGWPVTEDSKVNIPYQALTAALGTSAGVQRGGQRLRRLAVLDRQPAGSVTGEGATGEGETCWEALTPAQAALSLWEAVGLPLGAEAQQATGRQIAALLGQLELWRLRLAGYAPLPLAAADLGWTA